MLSGLPPFRRFPNRLTLAAATIVVPVCIILILNILSSQPPQFFTTHAPGEGLAESPTFHDDISRIIYLQRVLAAAGIDVRSLFSRYGISIQPSDGQKLPSTLSPKTLSGLRALTKALPLSPPLDNYEIGNLFGTKTDAKTKHITFHAGIDLQAPNTTPIYATATGVVTSSGYNIDYGEVIEIEHGNGIATRYARLDPEHLEKGHIINAGTRIGLLTDTSNGSSSPHLHYEILVNGEPQDPAKFLTVGRVIFPLVKQ